MKFEELPGISKIWIEFLHSRLSSLPPPSEMQALPRLLDVTKNWATRRESLVQILTDGAKSASSQTRASLQRLGQSECVVVAVHCYQSLLGGPVCQILKCLTAIKVCEELANRGHLAVPVCWISESPPLGLSKCSVRLLDQESEIHSLQIAECDQLSGNEVSALVSQIEDLGRGTFDGEVLEILRMTFVAGRTLSSASAALMGALMQEWGMIVLDTGAPILVQNQSEKARSFDHIPTSLIMSLAMPVIACVIDPYEIDAYASALPVLDEVGVPKPMVWPQSSATLMDARSRRILERYNLDLPLLYLGEEEVIQRMASEMPNSAPEKLEGLKLAVEAELGALVYAGSCKEKIVYQLEKLQEHFETARARKQQALRRQMHKACNSLAPNRRVQDRELAGIQIPLRYSRAGLRSLHEKLDILKFEHQLIFMG